METIRRRPEPQENLQERDEATHRHTGRVELLVVTAISVVLAVAATWPLAVHLSTNIPSDLVDPLQQTWQIAWEGHALKEDPGRLLHANAFWPLPYSAAFSDSLAGYTPAALIGNGAKAALVRYNTLFIFTYALAFVGAYLLARELGARAGAAAVAGAAYAYAPWRMPHAGHLNVLSIGAIPLALFLLMRGYRKGNPWLVIAGWITAAWQVSLGFTSGIPFAYLLGALSVVGAIAWLRGRLGLPRGVAIATAAGVIVFVGYAALQAWPFLKVVDLYPTATDTRTEESARYFSPKAQSFLAAPERNLLWGDATRSLRDDLVWETEQILFPGVAVTVLALLGMVGPYRMAAKIGLGTVAIVFGVLSLGFGLADGNLGFELLYDHLPGWDVSRTPGRLAIFTMLALGVLGAAGAHWLGNKVVRTRGKEAARVLVGAAFAALVLVEGLGEIPQPEVPASPPGQEELADPQLHLPTDGSTDATYMYWSIEGFPRIVNGSLAFIPHTLNQVRERVSGFPDPRSVSFLRDLGVETVIVHPERLAGTPWQTVLERPMDHLPLTRETRSNMVVYRIEPR